MNRSKKVGLSLLFLLAVSLTAPSIARARAEDSQGLGQFVDDYLNTDNVQLVYQVINNITLDCMELNFTEEGWGPLYENLTTYTEVDSADDLSIADWDITWVTMRRDATSWVVYDFGVDYFGDFAVNFTLDFSDIDAGGAPGRHIMEICGFSNSIGSFMDTASGDLLTILPRQVGSTDDMYRYDIRQFTGGVLDLSISDLSDYTMARHWGTFMRAENTITLKIFTDEARTNQIESLTDTGSSTAYRYFHVLGSFDFDAMDGMDHSSGIISNIIFAFIDGGYTDGYYYTTEIFANDGGLVFMYNATIETDTGIEAEFSNDNNTWVDHNNQTGSDTLVTGFESLDLRDLNTPSLYIRFNMTTTDHHKTPRLYQTILISKVDDGAPQDKDYVWIAIAIILMCVAYLLTRQR